MRNACRLLLLTTGLALAAPALAQEATFAIQGFTVGERVSQDELERLECIRSRWTGAERECRKTKEWKQVSASTSLFLDNQDRLKLLTQKFDNIPMSERSAEEVIAAHTKRFRLEPRRVVRQIGADKVIVASWGDVELADIDIQTRLAAIQGRHSDELLLVDLINNIEKSALDVLPIYQVKGGNGAVWTFYIRSGGSGWAMARIISRGESGAH